MEFCLADWLDFFFIGWRVSRKKGRGQDGEWRRLEIVDVFDCQLLRKQLAQRLVKIADRRGRATRWRPGFVGIGWVKRRRKSSDGAFQSRGVSTVINTAEVLPAISRKRLPAMASSLALGLNGA